MSDKVQLIKKEIERRFNDNMKASEQYTENSKSRALFTSAAKEDYDLLAFIDSLPEEPASEDLEDAAYYFCMDEFGNQKESLFEFNQRCFIAGAEWQKRKDVEEMMKTIVEGEIVKDMHNQLKVESEPLNDTFGKFGDKVKVIIVKED